MNWRLPIMILVGATACAYHDRPGDEAFHGVVYATANRGSVIAAVDGLFYNGPFAEGEPYTSIPLIMGTDGPIEDKSDATVRCMAGGAAMTFAVPREIRVGQRVQCNGQLFRVEGCEPQSSCSRYVVAAVSSSNPEGVQFRYHWSPREGVTLIDLTPDIDGGAVSLRRGRGFLSSP